MNKLHSITSDGVNVVKVSGDTTRKIKSISEIAYLGGKILSDTTTGWNSLPNLIGEKGVLYIYTDHLVNDQGENIPGFKVGDGLAYLIDLPFADDLYLDHIHNTDIHVTLAEKLFWNNKERTYISEDDEENLIFTKF